MTIDYHNWYIPESPDRVHGMLGLPEEDLHAYIIIVTWMRAGIRRRANGKWRVPGIIRDFGNREVFYLTYLFQVGT